jgi:hypothetical protein
MATVESIVPAGAQEDPALVKVKLELKYLEWQNEKLSFEINELRGEAVWVRRVNKLLPAITGIIAVAGFWFGIIQYIRAEEARLEQQKAEKGSRDKQEKSEKIAREEKERIREEQQNAADEASRRETQREFAKPLWDKQLSLYIEATEQAATIATVKDAIKRGDAEERFFELYWGPLAAVEDIGPMKQDTADIEHAMVEFGRELEKKPEDRDATTLKQLSLQLAHAVRKSIAPAFQAQAADIPARKELKTGNP